MRTRAGRLSRELVVETAHFALAPQTFAVLAVVSVGPIARRAPDWGIVGLRDTLVFIGLSLAVLPAVALICRAVRARVVVEGSALVALAVVAWSSVAIIRAAVEGSVGRLLGDSSPRALPLIVVSSLLANLLWPTFLGVVQATSALRRAANHSLDAVVEELRQRGLARWHMLDEERTLLARSIRQTISPTITELSTLIERSGTKSRGREFATLVQQVADRSRELVREASHEMQILARRSDQLGAPVIGPQPPVNRPRARPRAGIPRLDDPGVRLQPMAGALVILAVFGSAVIGHAAPAQLGVLLMGIVVAGLLTALVALAWRTWPGVFARAPAIVIVVVSYAITCAIAFIAGSLVGQLFLARNGRSPFVSPFFPLWVELLIWTVSVIVLTATSLWFAERDSLNARLRALARTRDQLDDLERDMARHYDRMCAQTASMLHGPVQGRLATIAMTLRFQGDSISPESLDMCRSLLESCLSDLDRIADDPIHRPTSTAEILRSLRSQWTGMLDITWEIATAAAAAIIHDPDLMLDVESMLADLASNAARHGGARRLDVDIAITDGELVIVARDDGCGPNEPVVPGSGLGSVGERGTAWELGVDPDGWCRVTVRLLVRSPRGIPGLAPR